MSNIAVFHRRLSLVDRFVQVALERFTQLGVICLVSAWW